MADNGESGMNYDNIFIRMLSRVGDAMLLSILFVLSCVPIITIGAAFTSLYYTAMKGISGDDGYIWKFIHGASSRTSSRQPVCGCSF